MTLLLLYNDIIKTLYNSSRTCTVNVIVASLSLGYVLLCVLYTYIHICSLSVSFLLLFITVEPQTTVELQTTVESQTTTVESQTTTVESQTTTVESQSPTAVQSQSPTTPKSGGGRRIHAATVGSTDAGQQWIQ